MKQGSNAQKTLAPGFNHYSIPSKRLLSKYNVVLPVIILLLIAGYTKNESKHGSPNSKTVGSAARPGGNFSWFGFIDSFKAVGKLTQPGINTDPMQKDAVIQRSSMELYAEGNMAKHIAGNLTTFTASNGDRIVEIAYSYMQHTKNSRVIIYLL